MAKKQNVNKSQAVRDYLKNHPKAMPGEIVATLSKQGIKVTPSYVANIKTKLNKGRSAKKAAVAKPIAGVPASPATAEPEKTAKAGATVTLEQVKAVALTVKTLGGFVRIHELLDLIKEVGGLKKFKDLVAAISGTETDAIPF
jgi:arginine repressor